MTLEKKLKKYRLRTELFLIVIIKIALIYGIWWCCFSHPVPVTQEMLADHLLAATFK